jgi:hypothetical protein
MALFVAGKDFIIHSLIVAKNGLYAFIIGIISNKKPLKQTYRSSGL